MTEHLLVSTEWLAENLDDTHVRVVDIRGRVLPPDQPLPHYYAHRTDYENSHIPGAVFIDWTQDIVEPASRSQDIASPERYAALMSRLGIGDNTFVVAYDDAAGMFAARMWWTLNYYGHESVAVMDGGWQKWLAEGRATTDMIPEFTPAVFTPRINPKLRRTAADILNRSADVQLMDVRTPDEFAGKASRAKRAGHIPGALNLPRLKLTTPEGTMLPPDELKLKFTDAGIRLDAPEIIAYCNGGVSASYGLMALRRAGIDQAAIYDGSWKDWGNDDDKPIE